MEQQSVDQPLLRQIQENIPGMELQDNEEDDVSMEDNQGLFESESDKDQSAQSNMRQRPIGTQTPTANANENKRRLQQTQTVELMKQKTKFNNFEKYNEQIETLNDLYDEMETEQPQVMRQPTAPQTFKIFETDYEKYLETVSNRQQRPIFDFKSDLEKPKALESKLKEEFINHLLMKNKIDFYQVKVEPILKTIFAHEHNSDDSHDHDEELKQETRDSLHHGTLHFLNICKSDQNSSSYTDSLSEFSQSNDDDNHLIRKKEAKHSICSTEIDSYFYDEKNKFMIVKTIEEMEDDDEETSIVIQTLRIYKEMEVQDDQSKMVASNKSRIGSGYRVLQSAAGRISIMTHAQNVKEIQEANNNIQKVRFEEVLKTVVSDSGPLDKHLYEHKKGMYQLPTSVLYRGKHAFFFKKKFYGDGKRMKFMLMQINLSSFGTTQKSFGSDKKTLVIEELSQFQAYSQFGSEWAQYNQVHFAKEAAKQRLKLYSQEELEALEEGKIDFLEDQFVQITNNFDLHEIQIYSMRNLGKCLSQQMRLPATYGVNNKFNQIFVLRDCENCKSPLETMINRNHIEDKIHFICLYEFCYTVMSLQLDENLRWPCIQELVYPYMPTNPRQAPMNSGANYDENSPAKNSKTTQLNEEMITPRPIYQNNFDSNQDDPYQRQLRVQVKCIQHINVIAYSKHGHKDDHLKYFSEVQKNDSEDIEEDNGQINDYKSKQQADEKGKQNSKNNMEKVMYFLDEHGNVQLLHIDDVNKSKQDPLEKVNLYYSRHILTKIGHPEKIGHKNYQVKATYVNKNLIYEDTKFAGKGIIEHFLQVDQAFESRDQQNKYQNYLISTCEDTQNLFVYKQHNLAAHQNYQEIGGEKHNCSEEYSFTVIKIKHLNSSSDKISNQQKHIQDYLNAHSAFQICQIPQIRLNSKYKGLASCWWSINAQNEEYDGGKKELDVLEFDEKDKDMHMLKTQFQEATIQSMIFETTSPPGKYFRIKICEKGLLNKLKTAHQHMNKNIKIRFFFVPKMYIPRGKNRYLIIIELKVYYKSNYQYFFVAENMIVDFEMKSKYEDYNTAKMLEHSIIDSTTKVQFFKYPEMPIDDSDSLKQKMQFKLSDPQRLIDYNLFHSRFFENDGEIHNHNWKFSRGSNNDVEKTDYSKIMFKREQSQNLLKFEKVVDSKVDPKFIPFITYEKIILPLWHQENLSICLFNNFMMQAIFFKEELKDKSQRLKKKELVEKMKISQSIIINPKKLDRQTIRADNCIQLWRASDFFVGKKGESTAHYKFSLLFKQLIDRVQIQEMKLTLNPGQKLFKVYPIGRTEMLNSSIYKQIYEENLNILQDQINDLKKKRKYKKAEKFINQRENYSLNSEFKAFKSIEVQDFGDDGFLKSEVDQPSSEQFNQAYSSACLNFGYQKKNLEEARCFELVIHSRLTDQCIINEIFSSYEAHLLLKSIIKQMMQMKPVMLKDFDFLLLHTYQSYDFEIQMKESFFQPQELYLGQTMCDINLNDPISISSAIQNLMRHNKMKKKAEFKQNQTESTISQIEGSLFDMVTQNHPYSEIIKDHSELGVEDYLIVSQDFNFKSQMMRSLEVNADTSYQIILESINRINKSAYKYLMEYDLFKFMEKQDIKELFDFLDVTQVEENEQKAMQHQNSFCNFELVLMHELIPTIWNKQSNRISMNQFRDPLNHYDEIVHRLANIASKFTPEDDKVEVRHKVVDFQKVSLGEKIRHLHEFILNCKMKSETIDIEQLCKCPLNNFEYIFDDLRLAQMMMLGAKNREFYDLETTQKIIDSQFDVSSKFYQILLNFYLLTFILPLVIAFFMDNQTVNKVCYVISLISLSLFFIIEICQLKELGLIKYIFDFWNIVDCTQFIVFCYLTHCQLRYTDLNRDGYENSTMHLYLLNIALFQAFAKGLFFVRIFDDYGFLVRMLALTITEMVPFFIFFFCGSVFFAISFMIFDIKISVSSLQTLDEIAEQTGSTIKGSIYPSYPGINKSLGFLLYSFKNSVADLAAPNYDDWLLNDSQPTEEFFAIFFIWLIWHLQAIFMVIILLNFLIAVITQAYEQSVNQKLIYAYVHKAEINLDYFQIQTQLQRTLKELKFLVFVESSYTNIDVSGGDWLGLVDAVKKILIRTSETTRARFGKIDNCVDDQFKFNLEQFKVLKKTIHSVVKNQQDVKTEQRTIIEQLETIRESQNKRKGKN